MHQCPLVMEKAQSKGHTYRQVIFAILANCLSFTAGIETGWISPMTKILQSDSSPTGAPLSDLEISWIASSMSISAVFGVSLYSYIADKYGSKVGVIMVVDNDIHNDEILKKKSLYFQISLSLKIVYSSNTSILVSRIIFGISSGGVFNVIPIYVKEISQDSMKGILGSYLILSQNIGLFTMYVMGAFMDYYVILYILIVLPILTAVLMIKAPDSPAFLVKQGNVKLAAETVAYLRGVDVDAKIVQSEVESMINEDEQFKDLPNIKTILKVKPWRRAIILVFCLYTFHALNGSFAIITYASSILIATGVKFNIRPELQTLSIPLVMIFASGFLTFIVERCGRKRLLAGAFFMSTVFMTIMGIAILVQSRGWSVPSWLPVVTLWLIVAMCAGGVAPLPYIIITEMFSFQIRAKVMGAVITYSWFNSFVAVVIYTPIATSFGQYTAFFFFGTINLLGAIFVYVFLPETKGKSDEEIRKVLMGRAKEVELAL